MRLLSTSFSDGGEIPAQYAASGENDIPSLVIRDIPAGTASLALIFDDADSAIGAVTHWIIWNIPPETEYIDATHLPDGSRIGMNGFGKVGYTGPAPPAGRHDFCFRLIALDTELAAAQGERREKVAHEMEGHVLETSELTGYFEHQEA